MTVDPLDGHDREAILWDLAEVGEYPDLLTAPEAIELAPFVEDVCRIRNLPTTKEP